MAPRSSRSIWLCAVFLAVPALALTQEPSAISLVPAADWRLAKTQVLGLDAVRERGGDPAIEREYGVKSLESRMYQLGEKVAEALIEETADASSAYGLLTFYRTEAMTSQKSMPLTVSAPGGCLMARGRYFIRITRSGGASSQLSDDEFRALLILVGGTRPPTEPQASLPTALPVTGLVPGSQKYIVGPEAARRTFTAFPTDLIGFSQGAEVQAATYMFGKERLTLMAIAYPTPQIARVRLGAMEHFLGINQGHGAGSLYGKRQGSFVFLVLGATSAASAGRLMDQFNVSQSVSWDKRYPGDESIWVQLAKLVLANLALVGILVALAILSGGLIFVSRRIAAKWFPSSRWGHPEEGTIIRLGLS